MPLKKIVQNEEPPVQAARSNTYTELYEELSDLPYDKWLKLEIDGDDLKKEIASVRHAVQRYFYQEKHKPIMQMVSRVQPIDSSHAIMWVQKAKVDNA